MVCFKSNKRVSSIYRKSKHINYLDIQALYCKLPTFRVVWNPEPSTTPLYFNIDISTVNAVYRLQVSVYAKNVHFDVQVGLQCTCLVLRFGLQTNIQSHGTDMTAISHYQVITRVFYAPPPVRVSSWLCHANTGNFKIWSLTKITVCIHHV